VYFRMQISVQGKAKFSLPCKLHHENQPPHHEITALSEIGVGRVGVL